MIQLVAARAALARVPWKLVGAGVVAFALFVLLIRINVWHDAHQALPGVQAALAAEESCADGSKCNARQIELQEAASHATVIAVESYEAELAALRARTARSVRVCAAAGDVRGAGASAGTDEAAPGTGFVSGPPGPDIGPDLYGLARDADEVVAQCRALQRWNQALSTQPASREAPTEAGR